MDSSLATLWRQGISCKVHVSSLFCICRYVHVLTVLYVIRKRPAPYAAHASICQAVLPTPEKEGDAPSKYFLLFFFSPQCNQRD